MVKKFKFRFRSVLTKAEKELEALVIALGKLQKMLNQAESRLKEYQVLLKSYIEQFKEEQKKILQIEDIVLYQRYLAKVHVDIDNQEEKINEIKDHLNKIRIAVIEKNKEKKILEKLRENDYADYVQAIERSEQKLLDELATLNYNRRAS